MRKIPESALYKTDIRLLIRPTKALKQSHKIAQRRANNQSLIIRRNDGVSYSDIVKDLKMNISPEEMGVNIMAIRRKITVTFASNLPKPSQGPK